MTSDDRAISALTWLWRLIKGWSPQTLGVLATFFSIIWGSYDVDKAWTEGIWAFYCALGLLVAALLAQIFIQRPTYMSLAKRLRETEQRAAIDKQNMSDDADAKSRVIADTMEVLLRKIAEHCNADSNSDRVSAYFFHNGSFINLARHALHPEYRLRGRSKYPVGQGAIGDAWEIGSIAVNLPTTRKQWERRLVSKHGYSAEEAASLRMHSVSIAALRIEVDHRAVGVIVFESDELENVGQDTIDAANASMLFSALSEIVSSAAMHTPGVKQIGPEPAPTARPERPWKPTKPRSPS
ncbi:hypothetical protein [Microbacterium sp. SA39]|uniref:hypothetical protein n=1 Tax=Microbacterium sp. SA39 TaxID=1263625 RepID=UPI0005FA64CA|nr:hypothetical protein [Microbacterium sp. SA39]KJQ52829.1 hypothetical protein RS85_03723 [Microbacterium sp. SA39]